MNEARENLRAFANFKVLNGESDAVERDHLIRNLAQLFSYVSDRCDDEQVAQYDEVLCQLADIVETEARAHVAKLLAPLERAPGSVVLRLAHDVIEVAAPLLEFSSVLSDDDLIEIAEHETEAHRVAIASRKGLTPRVGEAIAAFGQEPSVTRLLRNGQAQLSRKAIEKIAEVAQQNEALSHALRSRGDIDWQEIRAEVSAVGARALESLGLLTRSDGQVTASRVQAVVYNRIKNEAGFSAQEWKLAWNQVKALADRRRFDLKALHRFTRFGYGHHTAAGLTMLLEVRPEIVVKWLAMQDYVAFTVAARAIGLDAELFESVVSVLPWRDMPSRQDVENVRKRFEALSEEEASGIFELWRSHSFRRRTAEEAVA
ncbi:DUF2336 domain-containing protein [Pelagibacterium luteolum]|uniref:DUF2336 domain-containing protein n=1 Tax=Pelagibacterium luteolum TaxID=440168 RepID=A0A1G7UK35_9HYPH|nr:DUF2336 domain-containing protein [Pelagibacterium luteolum]SDG47601.1 hypothetical protein SAMN04487974_103105 [Pelagibacterium luteolum]